MDNFFKREEKTATENQVKASVKTMLGIMQHNKEIELPKDKKEMTKLLKEIAVPAFEKYLINMKHTWTSADTSAIMLMSDWSKFDKCYKYLPDADIPKAIKETLVIALGSKSEIETELAKEETKTKTKTKDKAKKKAPATVQAKAKPEDSKPLRAIVTDEMKDKWAARGMSPTEIAEMAFDIVKANS